MESCTMWRTCVHLWDPKPSSGHDSDLEESEGLIILGSTALGEPDDVPDDLKMKWPHRMISWTPAARRHNDQMTPPPMVRLKTRFTLILFGEVLGKRDQPPAVDFVITRSEGSIAKRRNELPCDPKWSHICLDCRCLIRKNLPAFETWIYVKAHLMSMRVESRM